MSEMNDMSCAMLADVAAELALGVLTGRERADAIEHLDRCEACREDVHKLMATGDEFLGLLPPAEPPAGFETRVLDRLGLLAPRLPAPSLPGRVWRLAAAAVHARSPPDRPDLSPMGPLPTWGDAGRGVQGRVLRSRSGRA